MLSGNLSDEGKAQSSPRSVAPSCPVEGREDTLPVLYFDSGTMIDDADYGLVPLKAHIDPDRRRTVPFSIVEQIANHPPQ